MTAIDRVEVAAEPPPEPTDPYERQTQTFPRLDAEQVRRAASYGRSDALPAGSVLFERGDRTADFFLVLEGEVEIHDSDRTQCGPSRLVTLLGPSQFTGELHHFNDRPTLVGARMRSDGRVARLTRAQFRRLLAGEPDLGEIVMRAFILRRVGLISHQQGGVTLVGTRRSSDTLRLQRFLVRNAYPVRVMHPELLPAAATLLAARGLGLDDCPVVLGAAPAPLRNPSNRELGAILGISEERDPALVYDVAVVGGGPGGLAAAVYAASEGLCAVVLEAEAPGGQAGTSSKIENYLGFPTGISGQALAGRAQVQAEKFGARILVPHRAQRLDCSERPYRLQLDDGGVIAARTVVIASGARYRKLDQVPGFDRFEGNGIHYAATALEAALCEGEEVVVVGGGNSAGQAAVYLSRHARHVHVLVRRDGLAATMSDYLIQRIEGSDRITLHTHSEITALSGTRHLERVRWADRKRGIEQEHAISNVFLMLGAVPNTDWLAGCPVRRDENGFVLCGADAGGATTDASVPAPALFETSVPGIFAVGDVRAGSVKRVASAVGEGSIVVSSLHAALAGLG